MDREVEAIEVILLDELTATVETIRVTDLQIRESVESGQWEGGRQLSIRLVELLEEKRGPYEAIQQKLTHLGHVHSEHAMQIRRCFDMSIYLLGVIAEYLPIYQRIGAGFVEKQH